MSAFLLFVWGAMAQEGSLTSNSLYMTNAYQDKGGSVQAQGYTYEFLELYDKQVLNVTLTATSDTDLDELVFVMIDAREKVGWWGEMSNYASPGISVKTGVPFTVSVQLVIDYPTVDWSMPAPYCVEPKLTIQGKNALFPASATVTATAEVKFTNVKITVEEEVIEGIPFMLVNNSWDAKGFFQGKTTDPFPWQITAPGGAIKVSIAGTSPVDIDNFHVFFIDDREEVGWFGNYSEGAEMEGQPATIKAGEAFDFTFILPITTIEKEMEGEMVRLKTQVLAMQGENLEITGTTIMLSLTTFDIEHISLPPAICKDDIALNFGEEGECVYLVICEDNKALNFGEEGECEYVPVVAQFVLEWNPWGDGTEYTFDESGKLYSETLAVGDVVTVRIAGTADQDMTELLTVVLDVRSVVSGYAEFSEYGYFPNITAGEAFDITFQMPVTNVTKGSMVLAEPVIRFVGKNPKLGTSGTIALNLTVYDVAVIPAGSQGETIVLNWEQKDEYRFKDMTSLAGENLQLGDVVNVTFTGVADADIDGLWSLVIDARKEVGFWAEFAGGQTMGEGVSFAKGEEFTFTVAMPVTATDKAGVPMSNPIIVFSGLSKDLAGTNGAGTKITITYTDYSVSVTPAEPGELYLYIMSLTDSEYGKDNGSADVMSMGGKAPYQYFIYKNGNLLETNTTGKFVNLAPDDYTIIVKDAIGNEANMSVTIGEQEEQVETCTDPKASNYGKEGECTYAPSGNVIMEWNKYGATPNNYQYKNAEFFAGYTPQIGDMVTVRIAGVADNDIFPFNVLMIDDSEDAGWWTQLASTIPYDLNIAKGQAFDFEFTMYVESDVKFDDLKLVFTGENEMLAASGEEVMTDDGKAVAGYGGGTAIGLTLTTFDVEIIPATTTYCTDPQATNYGDPGTCKYAIGNEIVMNWNEWSETGEEYRVIDPASLAAAELQIGDMVTVQFSGTADNDIYGLWAAIIDAREEVGNWAEFGKPAGVADVILKGEEFSFSVNLFVTNLEKGGIALENPIIVFTGSNAKLASEGGKDSKITLTVTDYSVTVTSNAEVAYYVTGNGAMGNPWCDGKEWLPNGSAMSMSGNVGSITFTNVPAGTYEFKVTNGTWNMEWNWNDLAPASKVPGVEGTTEYSNIRFTIGATADITITCDGKIVTLSSSIGFGENPTELTVSLYTDGTELSCDNTRVWIATYDEYPGEWGVTYSWYKDGIALYENSQVNGFGISKGEGREAGVYEVVVKAADGRTASSKVEITGSTEGCEIVKCEDENALNFGKEGKCIYNQVEGCTLASATNFDAKATVNNGSCVWAGTKIVVPFNEYTVNSFQEKITNKLGNWVPQIGDKVIIKMTGQSNYDLENIQFGIVDDRQAADWWGAFGDMVGVADITAGEEFSLDVEFEVTAIDMKTKAGITVALQAPKLVIDATSAELWENPMNVVNLFVTTFDVTPMPVSIVKCEDEKALNFGAEGKCKYAPSGNVIMDWNKYGATPNNYQYKNADVFAGYEPQIGDQITVHIAGVASDNISPFNVLLIDDSEAAGWWTQMAYSEPNDLSVAKGQAFDFEITMYVESDVKFDDLKLVFTGENAILAASGEEVWNDDGDAILGYGGGTAIGLTLTTFDVKLPSGQGEICYDPKALNYYEVGECIYDNPNFTIEATQTDFDAEGGTTTITITSTTPWTALAPENIILSPSSSSTGGTTQVTLTVLPATTIGYLGMEVAFLDENGSIMLGRIGITQKGLANDFEVWIDAGTTNLTCNQPQITLAAVATGVPAGAVAIYQWIQVPDGADLEEFFEENEENLAQFTIGTEKEVTVSKAGTYVVLATIPVGTDFAMAGDVIAITGGCGTQEVLGCTDQKADNYDQKATKDDGSCKYTVLGCTSQNATNYDAKATKDDGSCIFAIYGCTDPEAENYNEKATVDNKSCEYKNNVVYGCMDPTALNYNKDAKEQSPNMPCKYEILGCTDPAATNYNPQATKDNGKCTMAPTIVYGCTDPAAKNYNPQATKDNQSCEYNTTVAGCTSPQALNYNPKATKDDGSCQFPVYGCMDKEAANYNPLATTQSANTPCFYIVYGCTDPDAENYNPKASADNGNCKYPDVPEIAGCMAPNASNYNPDATIEDGSCKFTQKIWGCTDAAALNFDEKATADNGTCAYEEVVYGCMDKTALNFNPKANRADRSCEYAQNVTYGCMNPAALNYNPKATISNNTCVYQTVTTGVVEGCMDANALNFNPVATKDNGTCTYKAAEVVGCMQPMALNYNEKATINDEESCVFASPENMYVIDDYSKPATGIFTNIIKGYCDFDYTTPIDTAYIAHLQKKTDGTYKATWIIVQNEEANVIQTVYSKQSEDAMYYLTLICNKKDADYLMSGNDDVYAITIGARYKEAEAIHIPGCMNTDATNFDPKAVVSIESDCIFPTLGCTDPKATNFDPKADKDDEKCTYILGCTDPTATNYNKDATKDDGSCKIVAVEVLDAADIIVYPNPTAGILYVSAASDIKVFNSQGALLIATFGTQVDLSGYANGVYVVFVNGKRATVVKQ